MSARSPQEIRQLASGVAKELHYLKKNEGLVLPRIRRRAKLLSQLAVTQAYMRRTAEHDTAVAVLAVLRCVIENHLRDPTEQLVLLYALNLADCGHAPVERSAQRGATSTTRYLGDGLEERKLIVGQLCSPPLARSAVGLRIDEAIEALASALTLLADDPCAGTPGIDPEVDPHDFEQFLQLFDLTVREFQLVLQLWRALSAAGRESAAARLLSVLPRGNALCTEDSNYRERVELLFELLRLGDEQRRSRLRSREAPWRMAYGDLCLLDGSLWSQTPSRQRPKLHSRSSPRPALRKAERKTALSAGSAAARLDVDRSWEQRGYRALATELMKMEHDDAWMGVIDSVDLNEPYARVLKPGIYDRAST